MRDKYKPCPAPAARTVCAVLTALALSVGCAPQGSVRPDPAQQPSTPAPSPQEQPTEPSTPRSEQLKAPQETVVDPDRIPVLSVFFDFQSERIEPRFLDSLRALADQAKADDDLWIILEGHTDSRGSREFNMALAQRRATQVQKHLVELGVKATRIRVHTYGEERSSDESGSARRVDVLLRRSQR